MKTTQIMVRTLFNHEVRQRHDSQMLSATDLTSLYHRLNPGERHRNPAQYLNNANTQTYIDYLEQVVRIPANEIVRTTKGAKGGTWMNRFLFMDFAMWLSVEFKHEAVRWLSDNLCFLRDSVGNDVRPLTDEIQKLGADKPWHYTREIQLLQGLAGIRDGGRNEATEAQLRKLDQLQKADIKLMQQGVVAYEQRRKKLIELAEFL